MPYLLLRKKGGRIRKYTLEGSTVTIGRSSANDVSLRDPSVSRHHCEIEIKGSVVRVRDTESTHGIKVNGVLVQEAELDDGDDLRIGRFHLQFVANNLASASTKETTSTATLAQVSTDSASGASKPDESADTSHLVDRVETLERRLRERDHEADAYRERAETAERELGETSRDLEEMRSRLNEALQDLKAKERSLEEVQTTDARTNEEISTDEEDGGLLRELKETRVALDELKQQHADATRQIESLEKARSTEQQSMLRELEELRRSHAQLRTDLEQAQASVIEVRREADEADDRARRAASELEDLRAALLNHHKVEREGQELREQLEAMAATAAEANAELEERDAEVGALGARLLEIESDHESARQQRLHLERSLTHAEDALAATISERDVAAGALAEEQETRQRLEDDLAELQSGFDEKSRALEKAAEMAAALELSRDEAKQQLADLTVKFTQQEERIASIEADAEEALESWTEAESRSAHFKEKSDALAEEVERLRSELEQSKSKPDSAAKTIVSSGDAGDFERRLAETESARDLEAARADEAELALNEIRQRAAAHERSATVAKRNLDEYKEFVRRQEERRSALETALRSARAQLAAAKKEIEKLKRASAGDQAALLDQLRKLYGSDSIEASLAEMTDEEIARARMHGAEFVEVDLSPGR